MRLTAVILCLVALGAVAPAHAQSYTSPVLQVAGPAQPGAIVSVNLAGATPGALAVLAYGFVPGPCPVGSYATLGLIPAGFLVLGPVSSQGTIFTGILVPPGISPALNGVTIYFQVAVLRVVDAATGLPAEVDLTSVELVVLDVTRPDGTVDCGMLSKA
jgi:hypothetical protein